jgi:hypothetical protein
MNRDQRNLEDLMLVWLDEEPTSYNCWDNQVRSVINYVKVFDNVRDFEQYAGKDGENELICLIARNKLAEEILKDRFIFTRIQSAYLFGIEEQTKNRKVRGFFASMNTLLTQLAEDVKMYYGWKNPLAKAFSPRRLFDVHGSYRLSYLSSAMESMMMMEMFQREFRETNEHSAAFLWWIYLIRGFIDLPVNPESKRKFLNDCRQQYEGNKSELEKLDEFEATYSPDKALYWFTRDCFLYRILNKSLRTENLEYIFKLRFFIVDVHVQLCKLGSSQNISRMTVYRGQVLSGNEFESLEHSFNNLISINSFLSTSTDPEVALMYTGNNPQITGITGISHNFWNGEWEKDHQIVFLEIEINRGTIIKTQPFANIREFSCIKHENEVLFPVGSLFRIKEMDQLFGGKWHLKLEFVEEDDKVVKRILKYYEGIVENFETPITLATIGKLLPVMGLERKEELYYRLLLDELPLHHPDIERIKKLSMTYVTIIGSDLIKYFQEKTVQIDQKIVQYLIQRIRGCSIQRLTKHIEQKRSKPTKIFIFIIGTKILRHEDSSKALSRISALHDAFKKAYPKSKWVIPTLPLLRACETELSTTQHNIQEYNQKLLDKYDDDHIIKVQHDKYVSDLDDDGNLFLNQSAIDVLNQSIDDYVHRLMQQHAKYHRRR